MCKLSLADKMRIQTLIEQRLGAFRQLTRYMLMVQVLQNPTALVNRKYLQTLSTVPVAEAATMPVTFSPTCP